MKILRVSLQGFGPYPRAETVDFEAFDGDGKFVITGKTGAGKSSILDAVTFALFGHVPRYGKVTDDRVRSDFLQDSTDVTEASVEFSTSGARYRVTRRPTYNVPGRTTPIPTFAEIAEFKDDRWEVLASGKVKEVNSKVYEIVRLTPEQFQQVILLAQGQFQEFLVADSGQRRRLLRQLFDTGRFLDYSTDLDTRARRLHTAFELTATSINTNISNLAATVEQEVPDGLDATNPSDVLAWATSLKEAQREALTVAQREAQERRNALYAAQASLTEATSVATLQKRRSGALKRQDELDSSSAQIGAAGARVRAARNADLAWPAVQDYLEAARLLDTANREHEKAQEAFATLHPAAVVLPDALQAQIDGLTGEVAILAGLVEREKALPELRATAEKARAAADEARMALQVLADDRDRLKESVPGLDERLAQLSVEAGKLADARSALDNLKLQLAAAKAASQTSAALDKAKSARVEASAAFDEAAVRRTDVLARQLGEYASTLADDLVEGEPCAVCGSTTHPAKAEAIPGHITEADVARAESEVEAADTAYKKADRAVNTLTERLDQEQKAAHDGTVPELTSHVTAAQTAHDLAADAATNVKELTEERNNVWGQIDAKNQEVDAAKETRGQLETQAQLAESAFDLEDKTLAEACGDYDTIAAKYQDTETRRAVAQRLLDTTRTRDSAAKTANMALAKQDAAVAEHGFANAKDVESARLSASEQDTLNETVNRHATDTKAVAQILAEPDLQNLPDEPVDVEAPKKARQAADNANQTATSALGEVKTRANQVKAFFRSIKKSLKAAGRTQCEYEIVNRLALTVRGQSPNTRKMTLETFALAADLEDIVAAANVLLARMTANRYELKYSDDLAKGGAQSGLAIDVVDTYNAESRTPQSLSGGEKFQASLALALGLAEVVTERNAGVRLDTLFIDEGFGALDTETLDTTLDTVDALREGGRTVGLISHVEQVKERIPHHINVKVTGDGWSTLNDPSSSAK